MEDIKGTTSGGVSSARKVEKDLCNVICESKLMGRGRQPDELIHDLKRRMQEAKNYKTQARKESIHVKISGPRTLTLESQF